MMVWALLGGFLIWGDLPGALAALGIVLIVGAGLYAFWREQKLASAARSRTLSTSTDAENAPDV
ncbi:MAG: hypothetical protein AAFO79_10435 [Pseudomonadota bacterium]